MTRLTADFLRFLAIAAVLVIHATAGSEMTFMREHNWLSTDFLAVTLNQLMRFCVPVFVILSGYGLTRRYGRDPIKSWREFPTLEFYRARAAKIAIPFVFWTPLLLFFFGKLKFDPDATLIVNLLGASGTIALHLVAYGADYHFYFFIIILECYLFFPLLFQTNSRLLLGFLLLLMLLFTSPSHLIFQHLQIARPQFPSSFFTVWLFYFYAGICTAKNEKRIVLFLNRVPVAMVLLTVLFSFALLFGEYLFWSFSFVDNPQASPGWYDHFHRWTVIPHTLSILALFIRLDGDIERFLQHSKRRERLLALGAGLSFSVYILHTWVLRLLDLTPLKERVLPLTAALLILSFGLIYLLHRLLRRGGLLRTLIGLPPFGA